VAGNQGFAMVKSRHSLDATPIANSIWHMAKPNFIELPGGELIRWNHHGQRI
jgi:hypothetical protein